MFVEDINREFKREVTKEIIKTVIAFLNAIRDGIKPNVTTFTSITHEVENDKKIIVYEFVDRYNRTKSRKVKDPIVIIDEKSLIKRLEDKKDIKEKH